MNRREFLAYSSMTAAVSAAPFGILMPRDAHAADAGWDRTLILLELNGGNDGLNTVIPYTDPRYYALRPELAVRKDRVIRLDEKLGFHPRLEPLMGSWRDRELAIVLGVGYPDPNLSHFRGIDIWDSASDSKEVLDDGWVSRLVRESRPPKSYAADGLVMGRNSVGPLMGSAARVVQLPKEPGKLLKQAKRLRTDGMAPPDNPALAHLLKQRRDLRSAADQFVAKRIADTDPGGGFPETGLGKQFETAARLIVSGAKVPFIKLSLGQFDTHIEQSELHADLLGEVAGAIAAFAAAMKSTGNWDKVAVMTYAEFGRRPDENNSAGTDHGTSAPHFVVGGKVRGGFFGEQPPLDDLDNKNLKHRVHFRSMYASGAREWWGQRAGFIREKGLGIFA